MFTAIFVFFLVLTTLGRLWLASRQIAHVAAHRPGVPARFADRVPLAAHQKAADYTIARTRLGMLETVVGAAALVALTLAGGLQAIDDALAAPLAGWHPLWRELAYVGVVALVFAALDLPFAWYRHFRLEARFGFNRMTPRTFAADAAKAAGIAVVLGAPLAAAVLSLMDAAGPWWWVDAWLVWVAFNVLLLWLFPTVIAPLFNRFEPLADPALRARIEALLARCGFASKGVFVMDGSRRSAHGNAYFTGFGSAKRIVFFDTLVGRLSGDEIEAVLAHELGHFAKRHVAKRVAWSFVVSAVALAVLGWLAREPWFYLGLGTDPAIGMHDVVALVLYFLVLPVFTFPLAPLSSLASRRHEFEADAYAATHAKADDLIRALVKLYEDNAATLTPDPLHSTFYDSHPPAALRIGRLESLAPARGARDGWLPHPAA